MSFEDMDTASYDSEDKVLIPWRRKGGTVHRTETISVEVGVWFDKEDPSFFDVEYVTINDGNDIPISLDGDDQLSVEDEGDDDDEHELSE